MRHFILTPITRGHHHAAVSAQEEEAWLHKARDLRIRRLRQLKQRERM